MKHLANTLRRIANAIDPPAKLEPLLPVEFVDTGVLMEELAIRHDAAVILVGREVRGAGMLAISLRWKLNSASAPAALSTILENVKVDE